MIDVRYNQEIIKMEISDIKELKCSHTGCECLSRNKKFSKIGSGTFRTGTLRTSL